MKTEARQDLKKKKTFTFYVHVVLRIVMISLKGSTGSDG